MLFAVLGGVTTNGLDLMDGYNQIEADTYHLLSV